MFYIFGHYYPKRFEYSARPKKGAISTQGKGESYSSQEETSDGFIFRKMRLDWTDQGLGGEIRGLHKGTMSCQILRDKVDARRSWRMAWCKVWKIDPSRWNQVKRTASKKPRTPSGRFSTYYPSSGYLKRTDGGKIHQLDSQKIRRIKGAVTHSILP